MAKPADVDTAMRLGVGHPTGPSVVLAGLAPENRERLGRSLPADGAGATSETAAAPMWRGPVGVVGTGHMATGIVEAVARSDRPVRVLARRCERGPARGVSSSLGALF